MTQTSFRNPQPAMGNPTDAVVGALEAQLACYHRLAKLAAIQHEHVQQGQTDGLIDVLQDRQVVLDQIAHFELLVGPAKRTWSAFVEGLRAESRERAESMMSETRRLLEEITASDRDDVMVLQQRKLNLGRQINQASAAKQVNRNYAASAYGSAKSTMDLQR